MNILIEMHKSLEKYANDKPAKGFEVYYFEEGKSLLALYEEALEIAETVENEQECERKLEEIYEEMNKIVD